MSQFFSLWFRGNWSSCLNIIKKGKLSTVLILRHLTFNCKTNRKKKFYSPWTPTRVTQSIFGSSEGHRGKWVGVKGVKWDRDWVSEKGGQYEGEQNEKVLWERRQGRKTVQWKWKWVSETPSVQETGGGGRERASSSPIWGLLRKPWFHPLFPDAALTDHPATVLQHHV